MYGKRREEGKIDEWLIKGGNDKWSKPGTGEIGKTLGDACVSTCNAITPSTGQAIVLVRER